jgi:DNA-directed RNA polymerase subunit RPC12/RpoP
MVQRSLETVGVRKTGWAALDRDPQDDRVEYSCPHCGTAGSKPARRPRSEYHFTDGFLQDQQGEMAVCRQCRQRVHISPIVLVHNREENRRFEAIFSPEPEPEHAMVASR